MSLINRIKVLIIYILYHLLAVFIVLEVAFQILPTASRFVLTPVISEGDILQYQPNKTITNSLGINFYQVVSKSTNNYGFVSSNDYIRNSNPDVLIIGDSYIEAMQVNNEDSFGEVITELDPQLDVYQMGIGGIAMSQYLKMLMYAETEFAAQHYIILIVGNDFDESLCKIRIKLGTWCYDNKFDLRFTTFEGYSFVRQLISRSAFVRYVIYNAKLNWKSFLTKIDINYDNLSTEKVYAGNTEKIKSEFINQQSIKVINNFFESLEALKLTHKVTLILDADRQDIYNNINTKSYWSSMRKSMIDMAEKNSVDVIDMKPIFINDFTSNGKPFNFHTDGHWNERAHRLAAEAFLNSK